MRKDDKKQRRSLLLSTGIVVAGCLVTGLYVNQSMNTVEDYSLDLSQLNTVENADSDFSADAGAARANGSDVVNPIIGTGEKGTDENSTEKNGSNTPDLNTNTKDGAKDEKTSENTGNRTKDDSKINENAENKAADEKAGDKEVDGEKAVETASASVVSDSAGLSFSQEDGMTWPVRGDVILNYSMDSAVFFATLEQYKYNPAIYIGAQQGDNVSACARGKVTKIGKDDEIGNYVVLNLGNGYEVTCGQLEQLQVKEGDTVSRGQVIGTVAKTTKYYAVEGDHVYLKITRDGEPVNPLELLQ